MKIHIFSFSLKIIATSNWLKIYLPVLSALFVLCTCKLLPLPPKNHPRLIKNFFLTDSRQLDGAGGEDASRTALCLASGHALHDVNFGSQAQGDDFLNESNSAD